MKTFRRALVLMPSKVSEILAARPLLASLRLLYPRMELHALVHTRLASLLTTLPQLGRIIPYQLDERTLLPLARFRLAAQLRHGNYDLAYILPTSLASALLPWLAGIPLRVGYTGKRRSGLLNVRHANPPRHPARETLSHFPPLRRAEYYAALAYQPGTHLPPAPAASPISIPATQIAHINTRFQIDADRPLILLCTDASSAARRWPIGHFARLAHHAQNAFPYAQILILGKDKDDTAAQAITAEAANVRNLCGQTSLEDVMGLVARADAVVCNEGGLLQLAAALDRPLIGLYGPGDPRLTAPETDEAIIFWQHLDCSPCFADTCPLGHQRCLTEIGPEQAFTALRKLLTRNAARSLVTGAGPSSMMAMAR